MKKDCADLAFELRNKIVEMGIISKDKIKYQIIHKQQIEHVRLVIDPTGISLNEPSEWSVKCQKP